MDLRKGRHVVFSLTAHIVFVPKYRRRIFDADAIERLRRMFRVVCADFETDLVDFNGETDHVHLLVKYPPKVAVSLLVNSLKGVSSRLLRKERRDILAKSFRGHLWSPSYFVASAGGAPIEVLRKYIESQNAPPSRPERRDFRREDS